MTKASGASRCLTGLASLWGQHHGARVPAANESDGVSVNIAAQRGAATPGAMAEVPRGRKRSTAFGALAEFCTREQCEWE